MNLDQAREVLQVSADADEKTVRRAYAKLAKTYRPDTHPEDFARIRLAYDVLLDDLKEDLYKDPDLPITPNVGDDYESTQLPTRAVAYVMDEVTYGSGDEPIVIEGSHNKDSFNIANDSLDGQANADEPVEHNTEPEGQANPLQSIEDDLIAAIKGVKAGVLDSENKVVLLADQYLSASDSTSRELRNYVERFLIGACMGDYYIPHALRVRVADFCGLSAVGATSDRLKPWEREFLVRFEESELVEGILDKAASNRNRPENALVHDSSWSRVVMLRLDTHSHAFINRWMGWSDRTFGEEGGFVNPGFRAKWQRLKQVEPLNASMLVLFVLVMAVSGTAVNALGVPSDQLLKLPMSSLFTLIAGLAVLSWANFILVQLARPVVREYSSRVRDGIFAVAPIPLLVVEVVCVLLVIWGWSLDSVLSEGVTDTLVIVPGIVLILVALFARYWAWADRLSFSEIVVRAAAYVGVPILLIDRLARPEADKSTLWLALALVVMATPPRLLVEWVEHASGNKPEGFISIRHTEITVSTKLPRLLIVLVAGVCLVASVSIAFIEAPKIVSPILTGVLMTLFALELAISGGIHEEVPVNLKRNLAAFLLGFVTLLTLRVVGPSYTDLAIQVCISVFLMGSAGYCLAPSLRAGFGRVFR